MTIAAEEIYAVAGPGYVARSGMPRTLDDLANERLIHLEEPFRPAANWNEWFQSAGVAGAVVNRGLLINDYVSVIQAVMEGQGVALGWRHLTDRLIASGLLVRVSDHVMTTGKGFHVAWPKNRALSKTRARCATGSPRKRERLDQGRVARRPPARAIAPRMITRYTVN